MDKSFIKSLGEKKIQELNLIFQIFGILEQNSFLGKTVTYQKISDLLAEENDSMNDINRQIQNTRIIFNDLFESHLIEGNRLGTSIKYKRDAKISTKELKNDSGYKTLLSIYLSYLMYKKVLDMDYLSQILEAKTPISILSNLSAAIEKKLSIEFEYYSDRNLKEESIKNIHPVKIYFKDNHWLLVCYNLETKNFQQNLLHSISNLKISEPRTIHKIPKFNLKDFRKNSFSLAVLEGITPVTIQIHVPEKNHLAVKRRRIEGTWHKNGKDFVWEIQTIDPNEILDYVFKWNGILRILGPKEIRLEFKKKLLSLAKLH